MSKRKLFLFFVVIAALIAAIGMPTTSSDSNDNTTQSYGLIVGRNVNMVSGTEMPHGDPYLQRQNEPSVAVSTRNPMHLLAGANDYRTIDVPYLDVLPGMEENLAQIRDAWVGVFKSFNGGQSWISTLLPGYPQDTSPEGTSSRLNEYDFACDPTVRAGANGLFYYSGIAANRAERGAGVVFVSRYIDNNNSEFLDTIEYIDTNIPDQGNQGQFLDMPYIAVDVPRDNGKVTIKGQEIPQSNVYITYTKFLGKTATNVRSQILFARSTDCGETWSKPIKVSESQHILQRPTIAIDPKDSEGRTIYVAFRRFAHRMQTVAIIIVKSTDGGQTFTKPVEVTSFYPFDQGSSNRSFRTNSYPSLTVDGDRIVYLAWAQRMNGPEGFARLRIATSEDGLNWPVDQMHYVELDHAVEEVKGHQFMPSLTCAGGKLMLAWYDQRHDIAQDYIYGDAFTPYIEDYRCRHTIDVRVAYGTPGPSPSFSPSRQVSRYLYTLYVDEYGNPIEDGEGNWQIDQAEFNPINFPLFEQGRTPFNGDWMDAAPSPWILPTPDGKWIFNTSPLQPTTFQTVWTDNRDVNPPGGFWWGNWENYFEWPLYNAPNAPISEQEDHNWDWNPPECSNELNTGMRNQNIYTANISDGLIVGSPQNTKQLDVPFIQRTFVVYANNTTAEERYFEFRIDELGFATASFEQLPPDVNELKVTIAPLSSASVTVYVDPYSGENSTAVRVDVFEIDENGGKITGGLYGYVLLNPDPLNPDVVIDPDPNNPQYLGDEYHNPRVQGPRVWGYDLGNASEINPRVQGPRVQGFSPINTGFINPRVQGEDPLNPRVQGPRVWGPRVQGPRVQGINILNQGIINPRVQGPRVQGTALTDVTYPIVNGGNTTSAYSINVRSLFREDFDEGKLIAQLLIYKVHTCPVSDGCELNQVHYDQLVANIYNPRVQGPRVQGSTPTSRATSQSNGDWKIPEPTIYLEPNQTGYVTVRVWDDDTTDSIVFSPNNVTIDMPAQAIDTVSEEEEPEVGYPPGYGPEETPEPLPEIWRSAESMSFTAQVGGAPGPQYFQVKNIAEGTTLAYDVTTDVPWLTVSPSVRPLDYNESETHTVSVNITGLSAGTYTGNIAIYNPTYEASNNPQFVRVKLYVISTTTTASQVKLSGPTWVLAGEISKAYTLVSLDSEGNPANVTGSTVFDLTSTSSGDTFYSNSGEPTEITQVTIPSGSNSAMFYYKDTEVTEVGEPHTITATDSNPQGLGLASHPISVIIGAGGYPLEITTTLIPDGVKDTEYSTTIEATGGIEPLNWSILPGTLPNGLNINSATGIISGTPTESGYFTFTVQVEDFLAQTDSQALSFTVAEWVARYNGPADGEDASTSIAVDSSGNVYVTGDSSGSGTRRDYATIKYNSLGVEQWTARHNGPANSYDYAYAIAVDSSDNVYVTGNSVGSGTSGDYATIKYNSLGVEQWTARYNGPAGWLSDLARAIAVDSSGNVYVTGQSDGPTRYDYVTIKYNSSGVEQWTARYNGPQGREDMGRAIAVDSSGNVYVTGSSYGGSYNTGYATIKYDSSGVEQWVARYQGPGNSYDRAYAIAVDSSGNVYVTGESVGSGTNYDYATIKYDSSGIEQWVARYNSPGNYDAASAIAVDRLGNVYVTGGSSGSGTGAYATIKYDSSGIEQWVARYQGPGNGGEASAIAVDALGNVYVTGRSAGIESYSDCATIKYNSAGVEQWVARYNGPGNGHDNGIALAVDSLGNVYITGESGGSGTLIDYATIKYSQSFPSTLIITTETLDIGYAGVPYAATVWAFGGVDNRTWSIIGGALPSGLSLDSNTGVISGTPSADDTFNFTVQVTDGNLTVDKALSITVLAAPIPTSLAFTQQPSGGSAGDNWATQPVVVIKDQHGSTVTSDNTTEITLAIDNNPGDGTLSGTNKVTVVNGVATFTDLSIDKASTYYNLEATSDPSYDPAYTEFFDITAGSASKLGFIQDPEGCTAEEVWTQQPKVAVQDQYGNTVTSDNSTKISVVISSNPGNGTLSGTIPVTVSAGVATFTDLSIDNLGIGYNLEAISDPIYTHAFCEPFDVNAKITGTVMFNDLPVTIKTNALASFRVKYASTGQEPSGYYSEYYSNTGSFTIYNVPPGNQYYISTNIDTSTPPDGKPYPGEFYGYSTAIDVPSGQAVVNQDLNVEQIMHLAGPINNNVAQQWPDPVYDEYTSPVLFDWDAMSEASTYQVKVYKSDGSVVTVVDTPGITDTEASIPLPVSAVGEHYEFELWAFNGTGVRVGRFMIVYTSGHGWDYRFRVIAPPAFPEINIKQDTTDIADGGGYDFESHAIGSNTDVIFTIENLGTADLTITTSITITGTNSDQFSVQAQPTSPVAQAGSTTFTIRFSPTSEGVKYATIAVGNNDADENPYDISLNGTGNQFTKMTSGAIVEDLESSRGCAWGDYDNDGDLDLFVSNMENQNNSLYTNNGDGSFTKVTSGDVVTEVGTSAGCAWGDYDNDGDLDLFVSNMGGQNNSLYTNNGDGNFTKVTSDVVVTDGGFSIGSAWGDYDNDGDLDLFVSNGGEDLYNFLYTNNGNGTFTKVTSGAVVTDLGWSQSSAWGDYDNDGDLDLFVANSGNPAIPPINLNFLYTNNGNGTFTEVTSGAVVTDEIWSESCAWGDYDNDGDLDLFVANYGPSNSLYTNNGNGTFTKVTSGAVVTDGGASIGCAWGDYDNDGDLDLFVSNGGNQNNFLYTNNGDGSFTKVTSGAVVADEGYYGGCPWGDYDNDGDLDLFVANWGQNNFLYTNNEGSNNWLNIECRGVASNVSAIGAKVKVLATINGNPVWQLREISGGTLSQDSLNAEFGLGDATIVDEIRIEWPSGNVQTLTNIPVNQFLTVMETQTYELMGTFGSHGNGDAEFGVPFGIALDTSGNLYVCDDGNHRIQKFNSAGTFLGWWGLDDNSYTGWHGLDSDRTGVAGSGNGQFNRPLGIAIDGDGMVYVTDTQNNRVQKFDSMGTYLSQWAGGDTGFSWAMGIAVDTSGYVYVCDTFNNRVQKFTSTGVYEDQWETGTDPRGIAYDSSQACFYVSDGGDAPWQSVAIKKFNSNWEFLTSWGSYGTGDGQFDEIGYPSVSSSGYVYVPDSMNHRVQVFSLDGEFLSKLGGSQAWGTPWGTAINNSTGYIYITDQYNTRVQIWRKVD